MRGLAVARIQRKSFGFRGNGSGHPGNHRRERKVCHMGIIAIILEVLGNLTAFAQLFNILVEILGAIGIII